MKTLSAILTLCAAAIASAPAWAASHAAGDHKAMCEKSAADKKLAGAAKDSHVKKCMADAGSGMAKHDAGGGMAKPDAECEKSADDKKLAGAARTSHMKKCMADAKAKKP